MQKQQPTCTESIIILMGFDTGTDRHKQFILTANNSFGYYQCLSPWDAIARQNELSSLGKELSSLCLWRLGGP